ncbi:hypothetical protein [Infirmifilum sp. SLHALR2]|nr:MAG: hypothetical protein B7L53_05660 [Thermofilum sp. NZ13]
MLVVDLVAASGALLYLALGTLKWTLGRRGEAVYDFEAAVNVLLYTVILQVIFSAADSIAGSIGIPISLNSAGFVSERLNESSLTFANASRLAVETILYVQSERAVLASAPLTSPFASVLGAATGWSVTELSIAAIFFLHLSFASRVVAAASPYLALVGSALLPVPKFRRWGSSFLAIYLATSLGLLYSNSVTAKAIGRVHRPSPFSPADWVNVASIAGDTAVALGEAMTLSAVALSLATAAGVGFAGIFEGIYVNFVRV